MADKIFEQSLGEIEWKYSRGSRCVNLLTIIEGGANEY